MNDLPPADHELSDEEINVRFAFLFAEAAEAFRADPEYITAMGEAAAYIRDQRAKRDSNSKPEPELPATLAQDIVERRKSGQTLAEIAAACHVSESTAKRVAHAAGVKGRRPNPKITREQRAARNVEIRRLFAEGLNKSQLAREFNLSRPAVRYIIDTGISV